VKFGKMFGRPDTPKFEDPFALAPLCQSLGLTAEAQAIVAACKPSVAIDVADQRTDLPHSGSFLGGHPALPDRFDWPRDSEGGPMKFLAQFSCSELALAKLSGLPEEGLISVFIDALEDEPAEAHVYHFSLKKDLLRRPPPDTLAEAVTFRPTFHTIPSLPRPGSVEYDALNLSSDAQDAYYQLLVEIEESLEPCQLRCGGHPPFSDEDGCYPEDGGAQEWNFFLAVRDVDELEVVWPEMGCAMLWIPKDSRRFVDGRAELTWQTVDDDWDDDDEDDEDQEDQDDDDEPDE
jgi:uncharacterized protein YwqG